MDRTDSSDEDTTRANAREGDDAGVSRRKLLTLAGSSGAAAALAGCFGGGGSDGDGGGGGDGDGDDATPTPTERTLQDSITVSLGYSPNVTGDFWVNLYGVMPYFTRVLEPLVWVGDDMGLQPWLATDWESTGERTWEFTLREDVTFHNGKLMDADTVVFSIREIFDGFGNAKPFLQVDGPDGVRKVDDTTVEFTTLDPFPNFPGNIAHNMACVQHPDAAEEDAKPIGTGPFELEDIQPDQSARLSVHDDYWGETEPSVSEITFRVIGDQNTRSLALENHEVDVAYNPPTSKVDSLRTSEETTVVLQERPQIIYTGCNVHRPPTDDAKLRQALNYAADQQLLVETVLDDIGVPAKGPVPRIIYWSAHDQLPEYGPNRERARGLVEESSYDGETLSMLVNPRMAHGREVAEVVQNWFGEIGVDVELRQLEYAAHVDEWHGGEAHMRVGDNGVFNGAADILMYGLFHSQGQQNRKLHNEEGTGVMNLGGELDTLIEAARQTPDRETTIQKYRQAQQTIMNQGVVVPLYYEEYIVGARSDVDDLHTPPISQMARWEGVRHERT